jgi:hypothetical protein
MLKLKRAYAAPAPEDGFRVLVERLWPRGLTKEAAALDLWLKEIAPSPELRRWFSHDPAKMGRVLPEVLGRTAEPGSRRQPACRQEPRGRRHPGLRHPG